MRQCIFAAIVGGLVCSISARAQAPPVFEVASVKRNLDGRGNSGSTNFTGGRTTFTNRPLRSIIRTAYGSIDLEVVGGPAEAPWREMLKSLLADRFKLRVHVEHRECLIFAMVFARPDTQLGPKLTPTQCTGQLCGNTSGNANGIVSGTVTGQARTL